MLLSKQIAIKGGGIMESQILIAIVGLAAIITPISTIAMLKVHNANK
tara:strand:+ start:140 stop:280 length:141 start_codon:yes stop_codon:yes gene_type:complete